MNSIYETIPSESAPPPGLSLENIAGDAYLKIEFADFGYAEYKASTLRRRLEEKRAAMLGEFDGLNLGSDRQAERVAEAGATPAFDFSLSGFSVSSSAPSLVPSPPSGGPPYAGPA